MQLKNYQKRVLSDLEDYLKIVKETNSLDASFEQFWADRQVPVGVPGMPRYQNIVEGVSNVCYKVPTGGGKTLLGCASIKPIFESLPEKKIRAVVWLVPTESILTQTLAALQDPHHPYRQRLNSDFSGKVEVYSKEELLAGQNFSPAVVAGQLSIMVLSYDSFKKRDSDLRAYQANGNLEHFEALFGSPLTPIPDADSSSLFQIINNLNPVTIVDESHHARTTLSLDMLKNFNPSFVLDLTATPKKDANIISFVEALELKNEDMVKLPVIVYNRPSQDLVVSQAITIRNSLEEKAKESYLATGTYIRPIVLFQAEPKLKNDTATFTKTKEKLIEAGIPEEQIAIKTSTVNDLINVDLMSQDCPIRYVITVNALKEGWDCPFAYVLASLANKSSSVDVEQILGRILRLPGAQRQPDEILNIGYVLTSSQNFTDTLNNVVKGLNKAGFTSKDYRVAVDDILEDTDEELVVDEQRFSEQQELPSAAVEAPEVSPSGEPIVSEPTPASPHEEVKSEGFDPKVVSEATQQVHTDSGKQVSDQVKKMLQKAKEAGGSYQEIAEKEAKKAERNGDQVPGSLRGVVNNFEINSEIADTVNDLKIPQFVIRTPTSTATTLFSTGIDGWDILEKSHLVSGFILSGQNSQLSFDDISEGIYSVDVSTNYSDVPKVSVMAQNEQRILNKYFAENKVQDRKLTGANLIYDRLKPIDNVDNLDLKKYIRQVVDNLDSDGLDTLEKFRFVVAERVKLKIDLLINEYAKKTFEQKIRSRLIEAHPAYQFPSSINPTSSNSLLSKSLYEAEASMNGLEQKVAQKFTSNDYDVVWWHRIIDRKGFRLNGPINHYPDFILQTKKGNILLVETKGAQGTNNDSKLKIKLGKEWERLTDNNYHYFMVFEDTETPLDGACTISEFLSSLKDL